MIVKWKEVRVATKRNSVISYGSHTLKNMNRKISVLLVGLVMLDIIDGDFKIMSILDVVKVLLYIICFALLVWNREEKKVRTQSRP